MHLFVATHHPRVARSNSAGATAMEHAGRSRAGSSRPLPACSSRDRRGRRTDFVTDVRPRCVNYHGHRCRTCCRLANVLPLNRERRSTCSESARCARAARRLQRRLGADRGCKGQPVSKRILHTHVSGTPRHLFDSRSCVLVLLRCQFRVKSLEVT
jgi:hypothetical protein